MRSSIDPAAARAGVLADRVADDVVGLQAGGRQPGQAGELGRHERRLRDVGLAQALDRALEAELGEIEADGLRRAVVDRPRGRKGLAHRTPHTHLLGTLSREAERHLPLRHATSSQRPRTRLHREPERRPAAPDAPQASVNPNDSCASSTLSPPQRTLPVPRPNVERSRSTAQLEVEHVPGRTTRRKRTPSMPANSGTRPGEVRVREHAHRPGLGERLDHQHAGHDRLAREVPAQEPLVAADRRARDDADAGLELDDLVDRAGTDRGAG